MRSMFESSLSLRTYAWLKKDAMNQKLNMSSSFCQCSSCKTFKLRCM